jgi:NADPH:quinone reductase-like Zn-dependent oxidoreductase
MLETQTTPAAAPGMVRALVVKGDSETFRVTEVPIRAPSRGEVTVEVRAAAVNVADFKVASGSFAGRTVHARTSPLRLGYDYSGVVMAVGDGVSDLSQGDEVFGHLPYSPTTEQGTFAQAVVVRADATAKKPAAVGHDTAAAAATAGLTALQALRDRARVTAGSRVMIIGAAGGVGSLAVAIAKKLGATVTAVCSSEQAELVERIGADEVVARDRSDPMAHPGRFDAIFDTPDAYSFGRCRHLLAKGGTYVTTLPSARLVAGKLLAMLSSKRCEMVAVKPQRAKLELLARWLDEGLPVVIDATFPVRDAGRAIGRMASSGRTGRMVIDVATGW